MRVCAVFGAVILVAGLASGLFAAEPAGVTLTADNMGIQEVAAELSKQAGIQIVCAADVKATVKGSFESIELEKLLDIIAQTCGLKWQKIYLPAQTEQKPTVEQIKAKSDRLAAMMDAPLVVYDPVKKKETVLLEQDPAAPTVSPDKLGLKPIILISKPETDNKDKKPAERDAVAKYDVLQEERTKALMAMTPDQRKAAMEHEMTYAMQLGLEARVQMAKLEYEARRNINPAIRDQYRQMMRETQRILRQQGITQGGAGGRRGGGN